LIFTYRCLSPQSSLRPCDILFVGGPWWVVVATTWRCFNAHIPPHVSVCVCVCDVCVMPILMWSRVHPWQPKNFGGLGQLMFLPSGRQFHILFYFPRFFTIHVGIISAMWMCELVER